MRAVLLCLDLKFAAFKKLVAEEDFCVALEEGRKLTEWADAQLRCLETVQEPEPVSGTHGENGGIETRAFLFANSHSEEGSQLLLFFADPQPFMNTTNLTLQVIDLLKRGPATRSEISSYFNVNRRRASTVLSILRVCECVLDCDHMVCATSQAVLDSMDRV